MGSFKLSSKTQTIQYANMYGITRWHILIRLNIKIVFYGENGVIYFKFNSEYHGDAISREQQYTYMEIINMITYF